LFTIAVEAAKIVFHGTNKGLTAAEVAIELTKHCWEAHDALPKSEDKSADFAG